MALEVGMADVGQRVDRWLQAQYPSRTYGEIQKACRTGQVRVNGKRVKGAEKLMADDVVRVPPFWTQKRRDVRDLNAKTLAFVQERIVFEDKALIVFNKPGGLAAQGGQGQSSSVDVLLGRYVGVPVKLVHRLDKATSGLIVVAKTREAAAALTRQFKARTVEKTYLAVAQGALERLEGEIEAPLLRAGAKSIISDEGQPAVTRYKVLDAVDAGQAVVEVQPLTGRMHQIRAHLAAAGAAIVGDSLYGWEGDWREDYILLHAWRVGFVHPVSGVRVVFEGEIPKYFPKFTT